MTQDVPPGTSGSQRNWSFAASASSIIAAFIASICCVGPLVFALLGIGGAGLLAKFEPYRPYFIAVTFALLSAGFYFTYRKPKRAAAGTETPECGCPTPRANRAGKIMLWVATMLVIALLTFPYLAPHLFSSTMTGAEHAQGLSTQVATAISTVTLKVEGMTCASCSVGVRASLKKLEGVRDARVSVEERHAIVEYEAAKVTPQQMLETVSGLGYRASVMAKAP